jgi:DNA-binding response OmpR family regulator
MDRQVLKGRAILLVEKQLNVARDLEAALQRAGAMVSLARDAAEALVRPDQFDFSLAVMDWNSHCRQHPDLARRLKQAGMRFLFCANHPPGTSRP